MAKLKLRDWVLTFITGLVLLDVGILQLFDFSLVKTVAFNVMWFTKTLYLVGGVIGLFTLGRLVMLVLKKL